MNVETIATLITMLDLLGVGVFAVTGALVASRKQMDIVGFALLATVTGIGGGTLRDLVLGGRWRWALAVLGAVAIGWMVWRSADERERERETREVIAEVRRAIAQFREDMGRCPHSMRELVHPGRSSARYLRSEPTDGWGNPLWVRCPGRYDPDGVDVVSAGPSGNFLVDDNIQ